MNDDEATQPAVQSVPPACGNGFASADRWGNRGDHHTTTVAVNQFRATASNGEVHLFAGRMAPGSSEVEVVGAFVFDLATFANLKVALDVLVKRYLAAGAAEKTQAPERTD